MALDASTEWEMRPTNGDNTNGGGFASGISGAGTDYSQQDAAELSLTDLATSGAGSTTLTSTTGGFTAAMIGNNIRINAGTNFDVGYYQITAHTDTNTVTLDRSPTSGGAGSSGEGKVGGATASISGQTTTTLSGSTVAGNKVHIKNEAWNEAVTISSGSSGAYIRYIGYNTSREDRPTGSNRPTNNRASAAGPAWDANARDNVAVEDIRITAAGGAGVRNWGARNYFVNVRSDNNGNDGFQRSTNNLVLLFFCEVDNNANEGVDANAVGLRTYGCYVHDNSDNGVRSSSDATFIYGIFEANAGNGIEIQGSTPLLFNCTLDGNTGASSDGFQLVGSSSDAFTFFNNIFSNNGRYGVSVSGTGRGDYNNFFSNGTAARNNVDAGPHDIELDPQFAGADDFSVGENMKEKASFEFPYVG